MGEIADMHVEAYAAGLDPNEMDGADWADFWDSKDNGVPPNPWLIWHEAASFVEWLDSQAEEQGQTAVDVFGAYFPDVSMPEPVINALRALAAHKNPEEDMS